MTTCVGVEYISVTSHPAKPKQFKPNRNELIPYDAIQTNTETM